MLLIGGAVAQLGERLVRNEEVRGSNPLGSTILGTVSSGLVGANLHYLGRLSYRGPVGVTADANSIVTPLAGKPGLSTSGFVIERKALELALLGRRNRDIGIGPAVGRGERFVKHCPKLTIDPKITPVGR